MGRFGRREENENGRAIRLSDAKIEYIFYWQRTNKIAAYMRPESSTDS